MLMISAYYKIYLKSDILTTLHQIIYNQIIKFVIIIIFFRVNCTTDN